MMLIEWLDEIAIAIIIASLGWIGRTLMVVTTELAVISSKMDDLPHIKRRVASHEKRIDKLEFATNQRGRL